METGVFVFGHLMKHPDIIFTFIMCVNWGHYEGMQWNIR